MKSIVILCLLLVGVYGQTHCPTTYDPVVHASTGIPFYNDCLARRQLGATAAGSDVSLLSAQEVKARRRLAASNAPSAEDFLSLLPPPGVIPVSEHDVHKEQANIVDIEVMTRYADEGFLYVGRPGFLSEHSAAPARPTSNRGEPVPSTVEGSRVSLRITSPEGDLYMKVWTAQQLQELAEAANDPELARLGAPSIPEGADLPAAREQQQLAATKAAGSQHLRGSRLLLQRNILGDSLADPSVTDCTECAEGQGKGNPKTTAIRTEVFANPAYPFSAVVYVNVARAVGVPSFWCSGALAGTTGRLVVTAGHCVYNYDRAAKRGVGFYQEWSITPGFSRRNGTNTLVMPYARMSGFIAEVQAGWMSSGSWGVDVAALRLGFHVPTAGTLGLSNTYPTGTSISITSAGYPGDKLPVGTLWRQTVTDSAATLFPKSQETVNQAKMGFAYAAGQDGSPMWTTADNVMRYVMSGSPPTNGLGVLITPTTFAWLSRYTQINIIDISLLLLSGGSNKHFIKCNTTTLRCVSSAVRAESTTFHPHPIERPGRFMYRVAKMSLCLAVVSNTTVGLAPCDAERFNPGLSMLWATIFEPLLNNVRTIRSQTTGQPLLRSAGLGLDLTVAPLANCMAPNEAPCAWADQGP